MGNNAEIKMQTNLAIYQFNFVQTRRLKARLRCNLHRY